jgi:Kelch motif
MSQSALQHLTVFLCEWRSRFLTDVLKGEAMNVEIYDPRTDTWSPAAATMTSSRASSWLPPQHASSAPASVGSRQQFAIAVDDNGILFVVGGRDGLKTINAVSAFDPRTARWTAEQGLGTQRHGLGQYATVQSFVMIVQIAFVLPFHKYATLVIIEGAQEWNEISVGPHSTMKCCMENHNSAATDVTRSI